MQDTLEFALKERLAKHNEILAMITHDLKSPVIAIIGFADYLSKELNKKEIDPVWLEMVRRISSAGNIMLSQIENILSMAKMEAGAEPLETIEVDDLKGEILETLATFDLEAKAKKIDMAAEIVEPLPVVTWDMMRIRHHVLNNIVSNALKFTPAGGRISLSILQNGDLVEIRIKDSGPGIPAKDHKDIFSRFEQSKTDTKRVFGGHGLGLHNARLFAVRHKGRISVETSNKDGTTILVEIPIGSGVTGGELQA